MIPVGVPPPTDAADVDHHCVMTTALRTVSLVPLIGEDTATPDTPPFVGLVSPLAWLRAECKSS
jgi:hypothetical protein